MINYAAIHQAYGEYKGSVGAGASVPQPEKQNPMHNLMVHAMSQAKNKEGEDHGTMLIRALSELAKKTIPDVSGIHKPASPTPQLAANPPLMAER